MLTCCPFNHQTCIIDWNRKTFSRQMQSGLLSVKIKWITVKCLFPTKTPNKLKQSRFPNRKRCISWFTQRRRYWYHILNQLGFIRYWNSWLGTWGVFPFFVRSNSWITWLDINFWYHREHFMNLSQRQKIATKVGKSWTSKECCDKRACILIY